MALKTIDFADGYTSATLPSALLMDYTMAVKSADYTLAATDQVIVDDTGVTLTLPTAVGIEGKWYLVKNISAGTTTILPNGAETIDGDSSATLTQQYTSLYLVSDNANWQVLGSY
jgi:hypothetical protein